MMHRLLLSRRSAHPSFVAAAALATSAACAVVGDVASSSSSSSSSGGKTALAESLSTREEVVRDRDNYGANNAKSIPRSSSSRTASSRVPMLASSAVPSPLRPDNAARRTNRSVLAGENNSLHPNVVECDYVVVGHGKAGQSAVRTIKRLDPSAEVLIIEPNNGNYNFKPISNQHSNATRKMRGILSSTNTPSRGSIHQLTTRASYIDHSQKLIHVHPITMNNPQPTDDNGTSNDNDNNMVVRYRKSALLATGSRGAPPPESCIRQDARSRVLELRTTSLLQNSASQTLQNGANNNEARRNNAMPVLDPQMVRSLSIMAASQGASVAIMGSGFEALELASSCAYASGASRSRKRNNTKNDNNNNNNNGNNHNPQPSVLLLFGNSSPMSNTLPRYLSAAVTKRMRQWGLEIEERSMTRYISMENVYANSNNQQQQPPRLELYTVKSYDNLDSKRINADLLVLAPSVDGLNGTAAVPTISTESPSSSASVAWATTTTSNRVIHLPWSSLVSPPLLTCFMDDGRIMTNAEFNAASSLYAAGSAARYPDARTGRAEVAGGRHVSSEEAGEAAARNMVGSSGRAEKMGASTTRTLGARESMRVWRSDAIPYLPSPDNTDESDAAKQEEQFNSSKSLALYSMGIHALCVGRCDSEGMATHGFWWTNTKDQQSNNGSDSKNGNDGGKATNNGNAGDNLGEIAKSVGPNAFMRRATRRMATAPSSSLSNSKAGNGGSHSSRRGSLPVYGSGIVYYLSRTGSIEGIMTWGLPYSSNSSDVRSPLNDELVERMKEVIRSNGGNTIRDHSEKIMKENAGVGIDVGFLTYLHLSEESRYLASMALSGSSSEGMGISDESPMEGGHPLSQQRGKRRVRVLGRPLHRYTPTKPTELTNIGKMHRKDDLGHFTEEDDLFYSKTNATAELSMAASSSHIQRAEESGRPPSLKRVYPMQQGAGSTQQEEIEFEKEIQRRQIQNERSRPPKEEPLWLRQGEEHRFISKRDAMAESFLRNISSGRFSDGRDSVRQAPVPKVYLDAKEKFRELIGGDETEGEDDGEKSRDL